MLAVLHWRVLIVVQLGKELFLNVATIMFLLAKLVARFGSMLCNILTNPWSSMQS